jgi:uncharacterized protein (TIGR04255 family)
MRWEPARADHSIDRALVSVRLVESLNADAFDELVVAARKSAASHNLTSRTESIDPMEIPAGKQVVFNINPSTAAPRRVHFQRLDQDGSIADEFSVGNSRFMFATLRYRRWADLFKMVSGCMEGAFAALPAAARVKAIRLEYVDRFVASPGEADHFEVISRESIYMVPVAREKSFAFHVHSGWFDYDEPTIRRLTNVNIDVQDPSGPPPADRRKIAILTMAELESFGGPLSEPLEKLAGLHQYLKKVYQSLITNEAADRVALG